ncbi:MAG: tetratricopeptide repeat protein, partial [Candidatus Eisenbacteria bacterium]
MAGDESIWKELAWGRRARVIAAAESLLAPEGELGASGLSDIGHALAATCLADARHLLGTGAEAEGFFTRLGRRVPESGLAELGLGRLAQLQQEYTAAESLLTIAAERFARAGHTDQELVAREALASSLWAQGRYEEALEAFTRLEGRIDPTRSPPVVDAFHPEERRIEPGSAPLLALHTSLGLGMTLKDLARAKGGSYAEMASTRLTDALATSRRLDLPAWEAEALIALSIIARWQSDFDRCLALREEALAAYERIGDEAEVAACLQRIASLQLMLEDLPRAHANLRRAWEMTRETGSSLTAGWVALNLGIIAYMTGEYERAEEMLDEAARRGQENAGTDLLAASLVNLGIVQTDRGRYEAALASFDQALAQCRAIRNRMGEVQTLQNAGLCLYKMNDYPRALERLEAAEAATEGVGGQIGLTRVFLARDVGYCQIELGRLDAARVSMTRALDLARETGQPSLEADALWGLALLARRELRRADALDHLAAAMDICEGIRSRLGGAPRAQSSAFARRGDLYCEAIDILADLHAGDPSGGFAREAYAIAQRGRARSLLDLLAESEVDLRIHADPAYRERENALLDDIAEHLRRLDAAPDSAAFLSAETARLEQDLDLLGGELHRVDPRYGEIRYAHPPELADVQTAILAPDELLLEYI